MLISGGASRLGQATANRLANKGAEILLTDLPQSNGATIAKEIGKNVHFMPADATSEESVEMVVNDISKKFGKLHVLVNCLGLESAQKDNGADDLNLFSDQIQVLSAIQPLSRCTVPRTYILIILFYFIFFLDFAEKCKWNIQYDANNGRIDR